MDAATSSFLRDADFSSLKVGGRLTTNQGAETAKTAGASLTASELLSGIITITLSDAANFTFPTAASVVSAMVGPSANQAFDFNVINTNSSNAGTLVVLSSNVPTLVGAMAVAAATSGHFRVKIGTATSGSEAYSVFRLA